MAEHRVRLSTDAEAVDGYRQLLKAFGIRGPEDRPIDEMSDWEVVQEAERLVERGLDFGEQLGRALGDVGEAVRGGLDMLREDVGSLYDNIAKLQGLWSALSGTQSGSGPGEDPLADDDPGEDAPRATGADEPSAGDQPADDDAPAGDDGKQAGDDEPGDPRDPR